jgi:hypothetical protein
LNLIAWSFGELLGVLVDLDRHRADAIAQTQGGSSSLRWHPALEGLLS